MDLLLVVALALLLVALAFGGFVLRDGPISLASLFRYRGPDGWPRGVQEDDDARFNWRPPRPDPSIPVVEHVHGRTRPARWTPTPVSEHRSGERGQRPGSAASR